MAIADVRKKEGELTTTQEAKIVSDVIAKLRKPKKPFDNSKNTKR